MWELKLEKIDFWLSPKKEFEIWVLKFNERVMKIMQKY